MTTPFTGILMMPRKPKWKHLLVDNELRRTACRKLLFSGTRKGLDQWESDDRIQCPKCAEAWERHEEWKRMQKESV